MFINDGIQSLKTLIQMMQTWHPINVWLLIGLISQQSHSDRRKIGAYFPHHLRYIFFQFLYVCPEMLNFVKQMIQYIDKLFHDDRLPNENTFITSGVPSRTSLKVGSISPAIAFFISSTMSTRWKSPIGPIGSGLESGISVSSLTRQDHFVCGRENVSPTPRPCGAP